MMVLWLVGLWIGIQKLPERCLPRLGWMHKYMNSTVIKSVVTIVCVFWLHFLLRDAMIVSLKQRNITVEEPTPLLSLSSSSQ